MGGIARGSSDPAPHRLILLRASLANKINLGSRRFDEGEELTGTLIRHPVNDSRKIVMRTDRGIFNLDQEDVADAS
jgi:hypothetical protein